MCSDMYRIKIFILFVFCVVALGVSSCTTSRRVARLDRQQPVAGLSLPGEKDFTEYSFSADNVVQDTLEVYDFDGRKVMFFRGTQDADGSIMASETLSAAVVTARFRNVAERHGIVSLEFQITVPRIMLEQDWQTRFYPDMFVMEDSLRLDMLVLTGEQYRKAQLRGYQRYNNYIASIVSDTTKFINLSLLERFLERNIPEVYSYKTDSTFVSEEEFASCFGVTERQAVDHYTNKIAVSMNERRKARMGAMWRRYVKAPIVTEGVRLDSVFVNPDGDFVYNYVQTLATRPGLRRVDVYVSGEIFQQDLMLYDIPRSSPLTFYISSVSAFVDNTERYLRKVIERRVEANTASRIAFASGDAAVVPELEDNAFEIDAVKANIRDVLVNDAFDLDSVTIRSFASPEGSVAVNNALASRRASSVASYFSRYARALQDSLRRQAGVTIVYGDGKESVSSGYQSGEISFLSSAGGENWEALDDLVRRDTVLTDIQKDRYFSHAGIGDADRREAAMKRDDSYAYMLQALYPRLRSVKMDFHMHRKGMVQDTVFTTEIDSVYMRGVQAIRDRDYDSACKLLGSYGDYNTALAYVAADRNASAMGILEDMERTAVVNYLLAIVYSRIGERQKAVQCYMYACGQERSFVNRGNLDPEIRVLIEEYGLFRDNDEI